MKDKREDKAEKINEQKSGDYTHIIVVLDRSASMNGLTGSTIAGFNGFMKEQKNVTGKATASLVKFAGRQNWSYDMLPVKEIIDLDTSSYQATGGSTALCDSIVRSVHRAEGQIKEMDNKPDNVVVVIITDGLENDSQEFNKEHVTKLIEAREEEGWDFVFLGANQDAIAEGGSMGIRASNAMNYGASDVGVTQMYCCVSKGLTNYRTKRSCGDDSKIGFFVDEDEEEKTDI